MQLSIFSTNAHTVDYNGRNNNNNIRGLLLIIILMTMSVAGWLDCMLAVLSMSIESSGGGCGITAGEATQPGATLRLAP